MLQFFRNMVRRPIGIAILALIVIAFIVTLYQGSSMGGNPLNGSEIATAGKTGIDDVEVQRRSTFQVDALRRQQPDLDMASFVKQGGVEKVIDQLINARALAAFGERYGVLPSDTLVDGTIAGIPSFAGPSGRFDQTVFDAVIQQRGMTQAQVRDEIGAEALQRMLLTAVGVGAQAPKAMIDTYARMLLETREGQIAIIPTAAFVTNDALSPADIATFFQRNAARYTIPERRVLKYATFNQSALGDAGKATEADIAEAYKKNAAKYAGRELRGFTQIIVPGEAQAKALLAKIQAGTAMTAAASAIGVDPLTVESGDRASFEQLTSKAVADAGFAAPKGGFAAITRSGLGYHIVRVDSVSTQATRTLDQVRSELVAQIEKTKGETAIADLVGKMDDEFTKGASIDEVAKQFGLTVVTTPQIIASGSSPVDRAYKMPAELPAILKDAFQAESGDDAVIGAIPQTPGSYIAYDVERIIPAAAPAIETIRPQVEADARTDRASRAAKRAADAVVAAIGKGTSLPQAIAAQGKALPAPRTASGTRIDATGGSDRLPPPVRALFTMGKKRVAITPMPDNAGWFVTTLDRVVAGDPVKAQSIAGQLGQQLTGTLGNEYAEQFMAAVRADVGVTRNADRISTVKRVISGAKP